MQILLIAFTLIFSQAYAQTKFKFLGANGVHSCGASDTKVVCWGANYDGEAGVQDGFKNINQLSVGRYHNCVVDDEGTWCWGNNRDGQLNIDNSIKYDQIVAGYDTTCGIKDEELTCSDKDVPTDLGKVQHVIVGNKFKCVIANQVAKCWGDSRFNTPADLGLVISIEGKTDTVCAIKVDGTRRCWGYINSLPSEFVNIPLFSISGYEMCGAIGKTVKCRVGKEHVFDSNVDTLVNGVNHFCVLVNGEAHCWGDGTYGEAFPPRPISKDADVYSFFNTSCFFDQGKTACYGQQNEYLSSFGSGYKNLTDIKTSESLRCYIENKGVKCEGHPAYNNYQLAIPPLDNPIQLAMGGSYACALLESGKTSCWGTFAGMGNKPQVHENVSEIVGGSLHVCVLIQGDVKCWGGNEKNQLDVPKFENPVRQLVSGMYHTCAIDVQDNIKCWGRFREVFFENNVQQIKYLLIDSPGFVGIENATLVSGDTFSCAYNQEKIACFGSGIDNQLLTPVKINSIQYVTLGARHGCLKDADGVKCWGYNRMGQANVWTE